MSRITPVTDTAATPEQAAIFAAIKSKLGVVPNLYRTAARQPAVLGALLGLGDALGKGSFDAKTREAIALAVAGANDCDYCASAHTAISQSLKVDGAEIEAHRRGRSADARLQAILSLAIAITDKKGFATDADLAAAHEAGLTDADVLEVIGSVVANIFTNYLNHVAQTEIDFPVVKAAA